MATPLEKISQQVQNPSKVLLFNEEIINKTYNQGAYLMRHKKDKVAVNKLKNIQNEVVRIGFPSSAFEESKYDPAYCFQKLT